MGSWKADFAQYLRLTDVSLALPLPPGMAVYERRDPRRQVSFTQDRQSVGEEQSLIMIMKFAR